MNIESWKQAWETNNIGFHKGTPHPQLVKYFTKLNLIPDSRVFLPLCGKTLDIAWLLSQGYQVMGVEVSQLAIDQLFQELGIEPSISENGKFICYSGKNIRIYNGDVFDLSREVLGEVNAIYDRAALVALPRDLRIKYTKHLIQISESAPQLVITFEYDQSMKTGPPFSLDAAEINSHYNETYDLKLLESYPLPGGLRGTKVANENIWLLKK
ncbi:MAG: thiopurine S-methyltransferase [Candidatus Marinimicrobia bacterium]|nr:thiopurine S-methyltransferase [Candidatus Neomarinimicrobiota bacterium]